jgi:hypothetical protein
LAFALLSKFYGRFPRGRAELCDEVVKFVVTHSVIFSVAQHASRGQL